MDPWTSTSDPGPPAGSDPPGNPVPPAHPEGAADRWPNPAPPADASASKPARPLRAVALRYDPLRDEAPRVVASGERRMARRIIDVAREHGVPLYQDARLVDTLMRVPLGAQIPPQAYAAIAEVLAFVYQLDQRLARSGQAKPAPGPAGPHPRQG